MFRWLYFLCNYGFAYLTSDPSKTNTGKKSVISSLSWWATYEAIGNVFIFKSSSHTPIKWDLIQKNKNKMSDFFDSHKNIQDERSFHIRVQGIFWARIFYEDKISMWVNRKD